MEEGGLGEGAEESCSDEAHVSVDENMAAGFDNESFSVVTKQSNLHGQDATVTAALLASPPSEPRIIANSLRADTSNELANKTSEDFYSKLSSID